MSHNSLTQSGAGRLVYEWYTFGNSEKMLTCTAIYAIACGATVFMPRREATLARVRRSRRRCLLGCPRRNSEFKSSAVNSADDGEVKMYLNACKVITIVVSNETG